MRLRISGGRARKIGILVDSVASVGLRGWGATGFMFLNEGQEVEADIRSEKGSGRTMVLAQCLKC